MGNIQNKHRPKSHPNASSFRKASTSTTSSAHEKNATPKDGMSRTASGSDINEKTYSLFFQLEKLAKILQQKTHAECGINGITQDIFVKYVFPQYPDLGKRLFSKMHKTAKAKTKHLGVAAFRQQCETYLSVLDDALIHEHYVKMFMANGSLAASKDQSSQMQQQQPQQQQQSDEDLFVINTNGFTELLLICFRIGVATYIATGRRMDVANNSIAAETFCPHIKRTLESVTQSCFLTRDSLSVGFVCRWIENNLPNLIMPLHRFCVHTLTTVYRTIEVDAQAATTAAIVPLSADTSADKPIHFSANPATNQSTDANVPPIITGNTLPAYDKKAMAISQSWLLATALPAVFTRLQERKVPVKLQQGQYDRTELDTPAAHLAALEAATNSVPVQPLIPHLVSTIPAHWAMLYDSRIHGVGANRFLHHVIGYKGPTLVMLHSESGEVFCLASPSEWRETHLYTGDKDCHIIQLLPKFSVLLKGPKLLYLNTCMRGYPKGLRAGSDPRKPLVSVDEQFEKVEYRSVPSILYAIEVYGCGDRQIRDIQLDIKKWQVIEAERQRTVKLTAADWYDHPDRYLLELGGRPQYNNSS